MSATLTPPQPAAQGKKPVQEVVVAPPPSLETYAECGDTVEWFPSADPAEQPWPAVVTQVLLNGQVTANVFSFAFKDVIPMTPAFHMGDPKARLDGNQDGGGWRHRPQTVASRKLLLELGYLKWEGHRLVVSDPKKSS